jgi:hypothetical protein
MVVAVVIAMIVAMVITVIAVHRIVAVGVLSVGNRHRANGHAGQNSDSEEFFHLDPQFLRIVYSIAFFKGITCMAWMSALQGSTVAT